MTPTFGYATIRKSGHNSVVEYELPKLGVAGSNPVARSLFRMKRSHHDSADLLLEIGTEEIPPSYLLPASQQMRDKFELFLRENLLTSTEILTMYTSRRLTLLVHELSSHQKEKTVQILGPPARLCYDENGTPTETLIGFAKSHGLKPDRAKVIKTEKGEYIALEKVQKGRMTGAILKDYLPELIRSITFPKSMRWSGDFRFARPIRWILALYGNNVVRFRVAGISSAGYTYGHRILFHKKIAVKYPEQYVENLRESYVIVSPEERLHSIRQGMEQSATKVSGRPVMDEELLLEVSNLVEYPVCSLGRFDEQYLRLPRDVILTAMKTHQRYFGVVGRKDDLLPYFLAVLSGDPKHLHTIMRGNESVLQARLADALFYWDTDRRIPLESRIESLKEIVWLEEMGTLFQKTERLVRLGTLVASVLCADRLPVVERAAKLAKTDLATTMIKDGKEFTTLEGKIGMEYALQSGESQDVAVAIYEHYLPRYPGDTLPETPQGAVLSIADKLDTIVGGFIAGHIPTGSQDPQGLRRHATGMLSIIADRKLRLALNPLVDEALKAFASQDLLRTKNVKEDILNFLTARIESWLQEERFRYDLVDAVLSTRHDDLTDARSRLIALDDLRNSADFTRLVIAQKRVANILKNQPELPALDESLLLEAAEQELSSAISKLKPEYEGSVKKGDYRRAFRQLLTLRAPIDRLFDEVLIMAEEKSLRMNRLTLVKSTKDLFNEVGDLSKIVIE